MPCCSIASIASVTRSRIDMSAHSKSPWRFSSIALRASLSNARTAIVDESSAIHIGMVGNFRAKNADVAFRMSRWFLFAFTSRCHTGLVRPCACSNNSSPSIIFVVNVIMVMRTGSARPGITRRNSGEPAIKSSVITATPVSASMRRLAQKAHLVPNNRMYSRYIRSSVVCRTPCNKNNEMASMSATSAACAVSRFPSRALASPAGGNQSNGGLKRCRSTATMAAITSRWTLHRLSTAGNACTSPSHARRRTASRCRFICLMVHRHSAFDPAQAFLRSTACDPLGNKEREQPQLRTIPIMCGCAGERHPRRSLNRRPARRPAGRRSARWRRWRGRAAPAPRGRRRRRAACGRRTSGAARAG